MTDEAVEKARAQLVHTIARTSIGDAMWNIGEVAAQLIVEKIEALLEAKAGPVKNRDTLAETIVTFNREPNRIGLHDMLPEGFTPAQSVPSRGQLPSGLQHDTHVQVIYRDGIAMKPAKSGTRIEIGEAARFNWKHAGPGRALVEGVIRPDAMIGNPDDDIIGYREIAPPGNKMAMPKAASG